MSAFDPEIARNTNNGQSNSDKGEATFASRNCPLERIHMSTSCISTERVDWTNLELGVALKQQHINDRQLADVAVLLKFLADLRADGGYGHAQGVHGLDLRGLCLVRSR